MSYKERGGRSARDAEAQVVFESLIEAVREQQLLRAVQARVLAELPAQHPEWSPLDILELETEIRSQVEEAEARVASFHGHPLASRLRELTLAFMKNGG